MKDVDNFTSDLEGGVAKGLVRDLLNASKDSGFSTKSEKDLTIQILAMRK
jgi:hypothetical protein